MYVDHSGHFAISALLLTGLIMGTTMVAFQGVNDLAVYCQTGNWDHVVWQDYVGAFIGGFVGGALSTVMISGLAVSLAATGVSRITSMYLQNWTGDANYSILDIAKDVGSSMLITSITYGISGTFNIQYFKTYSDLPYLFTHGLTEDMKK